MNQVADAAGVLAQDARRTTGLQLINRCSGSRTACANTFKRTDRCKRLADRVACQSLQVWTAIRRPATSVTATMVNIRSRKGSSGSCRYDCHRSGMGLLTEDIIDDELGGSGRNEAQNGRQRQRGEGQHNRSAFAPNESPEFEKTTGAGIGPAPECAHQGHRGFDPPSGLRRSCIFRSSAAGVSGVGHGCWLIPPRQYTNSTSALHRRISPNSRGETPELCPTILAWMSPTPKSETLNGYPCRAPGRKLPCSQALYNRTSPDRDR